jgi:hypothetical protein
MRDIVAHPFQREHAIEHACVAGVRVFRASDFAEIEIAENVEAVIDTDHDHVPLARKVRAVIGGRAV